MGAEASSCFACFEGDHGPYADSHRYTCFEDLQLDKELGHGAFSTVRLGINRKNKDKFAVKVVHKSKLSKQDIDALHVEVGILSKLRHPHVVKYFDFTQDRSHYYIVLEVVAGGELFDRIVQRVYYSEKEARDLVWVLLDVLHHLHGKKIAHRDLKPENLLLKSTHNDTTSSWRILASRPSALAASRRVEVPSLPQYDSCPSHHEVGGFFVGPSRATAMLRAGIIQSRDIMPDADLVATVEARSKENPDWMPYFHLQHDDYITLKERCTAHIASGASGDPEGIATIQVGYDTLKLAETLKPLLEKQLL